jgi:hypothetical protein
VKLSSSQGEPVPLLLSQAKARGRRSARGAERRRRSIGTGSKILKVVFNVNVCGLAPAF